MFRRQFRDWHACCATFSASKIWPPSAPQFLDDQPQGQGPKGTPTREAEFVEEELHYQGCKG